MSNDENLQDSIERTRQMFRSAPDAPPLMVRRDEGAPTLSVSRAAEASAVLTGMHPFFRGLFDALPEPGSEWSKVERDLWLETARHIFALIYQDAAAGPRAEHPPASIQYGPAERLAG